MLLPDDQQLEGPLRAVFGEKASAHITAVGSPRFTALVHKFLGAWDPTLTLISKHLLTPGVLLQAFGVSERVSQRLEQALSTGLEAREALETGT